MQHVTLHERVESWAEELSIDGERRIVRNVALAGSQSRNGYTYSENALIAAAALYENRPVFLDHAQGPQRVLDRSTRDLVGTVINARYSNGRVRGDIRVLDTDSGMTFLKLVEGNSPGVGMSHVVMAHRSVDGKRVDSIVDVVSVDVVVNPATTSTFSESTNSTSTHESGVAELEARVRLLEGERNELLERSRRLQLQLNELQHRESVQQLLVQSGLPAESITECFREQLTRAETPEQRQALIDDRQKLLSEVSRSHPAFSSLRPSASSSKAASNEEFLRVIRRRSR
ncbi:hypothetical protein [Planctomicrobium sp. SH527]|uniref:hypothetical protein n=1 Tax=Planctomicrobium sp. SH527 TaxID=3448123 RepID=UPI003F5BEDD4